MFYFFLFLVYCFRPNFFTYFNYFTNFISPRIFLSHIKLSITLSWNLYLAYYPSFLIKCVTTFSQTIFCNILSKFEDALISLISVDLDRKNPYGEIRFEFSRKELVQQIFLMASCRSSSPKTISVDTVIDKRTKVFMPLIVDQVTYTRTSFFSHINAKNFLWSLILFSCHFHPFSIQLYSLSHLLSPAFALFCSLYLFLFPLDLSDVCILVFFSPNPSSAFSPFFISFHLNFLLLVVIYPPIQTMSPFCDISHFHFSSRSPVSPSPIFSNYREFLFLSSFPPIFLPFLFSPSASHFA